LIVFTRQTRRDPAEDFDDVLFAIG